MTNDFDENSVFKDFKKFFEESFFSVLYGEKLELNIIVDSQAIISDAISLVKNKKSFLLELMKSPFLKIYSPSWLINELNKKIPEVSKKEHLSLVDFEVSVRKLLEQVRIIQRNGNIESDIINEIRKRDPKDVPYVTLYLSFEKHSHGILTKDKDISDLPGVKTWERPGEIGKVITIFKNGTLAYMIIGQGLPILLSILAEICIFILKWIPKVIQTIIDAISRLPQWIAIVGIIAAIVLLLWDKSREVIIEFFKQLYKGLKNILNVLKPIVTFSWEIVSSYLTDIEKTIKCFEKISGNGLCIL